MAGENRQSWVGNAFYWADAPGWRLDNVLPPGTVVEGRVTFSFTFSATNNKTGYTCGATLTLDLIIERAADPGPPFTHGVAHWAVSQ